MQATLDHGRRLGERQRSARCRTATGRPRRQQRVHELRESLRLHLDLGQEFGPGRFVPLHVGPAQAAHEALNVTQRETELVRDRSKHLLVGAQEVSLHRLIECCPPPTGAQAEHSQGSARVTLRPSGRSIAAPSLWL